MELARSLDAALARLRPLGRVEVRENGAWLANLEDFSHDVRQHNNSAVLHVWSADRDQVRRVTRIISEEPQRVALEVVRLGRTRPMRLEFLVSRKIPPVLRVSRERFRARFQ